MKKLILSSVLVSALVVAGFATLPKPVFAQEVEQCVCHTANNTDVCSTNPATIAAHLGHGDTAGSCAAPTATPTPTGGPTPTPTVGEPSVPEFGLVTGLLSMAMSYGGYKLFKKRS